MWVVLGRLAREERTSGRGGRRIVQGRQRLLTELGYLPISTQGLGVCAEKVRRPKTASGP